MLARSLPDTLATLLAAFAPCFTARTLPTFQALVAGFLAQPGLRTVTGMLTGAGLAGRRHHDLAYRFFASARWCPDQLGLVLLDLICANLVPAGAPIVLAVDDTLWHRVGRKIHGTAWHHDGNGPARHRPAWGHRWVVVGVIVRLPFLRRAICLPILARLWLPGDPDHTPLVLARELLDLVVAHVGDRPVHLVGDAAYIGKPLQGLPAQVTVTARLRCDAALYQPAPPPTGRPGRPRLKGDRLPELIVLAAMTRYQWTPVQVRCYGKTLEREVLAIRCVWYGALKGQPVQVILSRPIGSPDGYQLALVTTDLAATPQQVIERYSDRWPEEMVFPQLAKARVRALGCDEQLHQQPPLGERGRGQPVPDGPAETLDPVGDSAKLQPLLRDRVQLVLLVGQGGPAALQLPSLALELVQGDDLGQVGVQQPLLLALQLRDGLADGALAGVQLLRQPLPTTGPRQRRGNLGRISQQRGQVSPDQLVQLRGGGAWLWPGPTGSSAALRCRAGATRVRLVCARPV